MTDHVLMFLSRIGSSHNTRIYRFGLPTASASLDLPIGQHISLKYVSHVSYSCPLSLVCGVLICNNSRLFRAQTKYSDKVEYRSYTPISDDADVGYFDLLVKVYDKGVMTRHLDDLAIGDTIDVRGPKGKFSYSPSSHSTLTMLAGGTGITPMFQIIKAIAKVLYLLFRVSLSLSDFAVYVYVAAAVVGL
jgi:cytochrome-b5 reductase